MKLILSQRRGLIVGVESRDLAEAEFELGIDTLTGPLEQTCHGPQATQLPGQLGCSGKPKGVGANS
jgi:hypothetical protein